MLEDIVNNVPSARHAVLLSADGLPRGATAGMTAEGVNTISAAMAGMQSLSRATAPFAGQGQDRQWKQTVIEFSHGWIFLVAAGQGAYLAAAAAPDVDMQQITFRMQQLVGRLGRELTSPPRTVAEEQPRRWRSPSPEDSGQQRSSIPGLDEVVSQVPGARHAVLLAADGLPRGATRGMDPDLADTIAAAMTGMQSLSRATAPFAGADPDRQWLQTVVEFSHGWIFLIAAGHGACLAAAAAHDTDIEDITTRMHRLVPELGQYLSAPARETADQT
ncbi:roadblock/LC7 domain-containing protein [Streptomyces sp.]|uniref:roadblock/LC7 domain-containing protein n=1 Tax=Streptomyces sp. TaxID=1931 RepID=UPI0039C97C63